MEQDQTNNKHNKKIGDWGEKITANYLKRQGFDIVAMNYWKKWGEIDVIARKQRKIHFVEVKTVSYETKEYLNKAVSYGTWRPEENVHPYKLRKLNRAIDTWLTEYSWEGDWQIDVAAVRIVPRETYATINYIENIIIF